jgi:hypothetical protein
MRYSVISLLNLATVDVISAILISISLRTECGLFLPHFNFSFLPFFLILSFQLFLLCFLSLIVFINPWFE